MNKFIFALLIFLIVGGFAFFVQTASAQNAVPSRDTLQATLITDSAKKLYELRKQRSIKRFGPRCQVNGNGLPKYCDDVESLNHGITATIDTEIAWQFFELNKEALGIIDPLSEIRLDIRDSLEYPEKLDTMPIPRSRGETYSDYQWRLLNKIRAEKKRLVGTCLVFYQYYKDYVVSGSEIILSIDTLGVIRGFNYSFFPEVHEIDLNSFISETEARRIAVQDTTINWMIRGDPTFKEWMELVKAEMPKLAKYLGKWLCEEFQKYISCDNNECTIGYEATVCVNQDAYVISIDGKTGKVTYRGVLL